MRVLWFCNCPVLAQDGGDTGTWLDNAASRLIMSDKIKLGVVAGGGDKVERVAAHGFTQWVAPGSFVRNGLPTKDVVDDLVRIVDEFKPHIVHVWGIEGYWGLLIARGLIKSPAVLTIQGIKSSIAPLYMGGLTFGEQVACVGLKEFLRRRTLWQMRDSFACHAAVEREILNGFKYYLTNTEWAEAQVTAMDQRIKLLPAADAINEKFFDTPPWEVPDVPTMLCVSAYPAPFKGLHVAVRALALARERFPSLTLRIAGSLQRKGLRNDGYVRWLNREINRLGLGQHVVWLGSLTSSKLAEELLAASMLIVPSFIENFCISMQEAMVVGTPVVASFAGGLPSWPRYHGKTCLFFPPGDVQSCAYQVQRLLADPELCQRISTTARLLGRKFCGTEQVIKRLEEIYCQVIVETGELRL